MMTENLTAWGFTERYEQEVIVPFLPARVTEQHRDRYTVVTENGFLQAAVSGKWMHDALDGADYPSVGDWVTVEAGNGSAVIRQILTRSSIFIRKAAGTTRESQVVAANVDTVFICMALNEDYNLRRLERYLAITWDSGAVPIVVLTKSDLCEDAEQKRDAVAQIAMGAEILVCSSLTEDGYTGILPHIRPGRTIALIGSSGVGKSTLINRLLGGETLATKEIADDGRGRHTTTRRQLMLLPGGGLVMDTPGMRELGAVVVDLETTFADIEALAEGCRFGDCKHAREPGCAVRAALESGALDAARFENFQKLRTEADYNGLSFKQIEEEKLKRMFGGKNEMKQFMREIKKKNARR